MQSVVYCIGHIYSKYLLKYVIHEVKYGTNDLQP